MIIKFNTYGKRSLGKLFTSSDDCTMGKTASVNISLNNVDRMEVIHISNGIKYKDVVKIDNDKIIIPFKKELLKIGTNIFEVLAYMKNGDIKISQTYIYDVTENTLSNSISSIYNKSNVEFSEFTINDIRVYPIVIDMDSVEPIQSPIKFKQYDFGSSYIVLQLLDNDKPLQLNDVTIAVSYKNPINNTVIDTITYLNETSVLSSINGIVKILVPNDAIRYKGNVECELMIFDSEHRRSTSPSISFEVVSSLLNHEEDNDIVDDDRYTLLTTLLTQVGIIQKDAEKILNDANILKNEVIDLKDEIIIISGQIEDVIVDAENRIQVIENTFTNELTSFKTQADETINNANQQMDVIQNTFQTELITMKTEIDNKIIDVEDRMQVIESTFNDLVIGTGFASIQYVDAEISKQNNKILEKADKATTYTKSEVDNIVNSKTQIDDNNTSETTVWSSKKTYDEIQTIVSSTINVSDTVSVVSSEWNPDGELFKINVVHNLQTDKVIPMTYDTNSKDALFLGYRIIDSSTIEFKSDNPEDMTVIIINGGIPTNDSNVTIDDTIIGTTQTWSSKKIKDTIDANSPTMPDGSSMVDSIVANKTSIENLQNELGSNKITLEANINAIRTVL